jgi:hypothetical protein
MIIQGGGREDVNKRYGGKVEGGEGPRKERAA